jgi:hypothetical protein
MSTIAEPAAGIAPVLYFSLASKRRIRACALWARPAFRIVKAKRSVKRLFAIRHAALSRLLAVQWHLHRCASSWSRA